MGWKNIKEGYQIKHQVCVSGKGICIGSPYIHDIIVIGLDGVVKKRYEDRSNVDLLRYQQEMDADPDKLAQLAKTPDSFETSIVVYTYEGGDIIENRCETPGWPNATHDGDMMYENTYSTDRDIVVQWAKRNADAGVEMTQRAIEELESALQEKKLLLTKIKNEQARLEVA